MNELYECIRIETRNGWQTLEEAGLGLGFLDLETTGYCPYTQEVCELAFITEDGAEHHMLVQPTRLGNASEEALRVNGYDSGLWYREGVSSEYAVKELHQLTKDRVIVCQNPLFDLEFTRYWFYRFGLSKNWFYKPLDTGTMAFTISGGSFPRQTTINKILGTSCDRPHRALDDARALKENFDKMLDEAVTLSTMTSDNFCF